MLHPQAEKTRLRYITRRMSGTLHTTVAKNKALALKLEQAAGVIAEQRREIDTCHVDLERKARPVRNTTKRASSETTRHTAAPYPTPPWNANRYNIYI